MNQRALFWLLLVATIGYALFMKQAVVPLTSKEIVAYELAKTPDRTNTILEKLALLGQTELLRKSIYLDFLFLLLYGSALFVGCRYATRLAAQVGAQRTWVRIGYGLAWLGIAALVTDAIENMAMLVQLPPGNVTASTALLAWAMASLKIISIVVTLLTVITGFSYYGIKRMSIAK